MNVAGYREALAAAQSVEIQPGLVIRVASLPGLAILKLFAWADRGADDPRDAIDLARLLRQYGEAGNEHRLYDAEIRVLQALDYDFGLAGPRLLGRDAALMTAPTTRAQIFVLLDDAQRLDRLIRDMAREMGAVEDPLAAARDLIAQFKTGLQEI